MKLHDVINQYRIVPRLMALFMMYMTWLISHWFMGLETPGAEQAGFVSAWAASSVAFFKFYLDTPKRSVTNNTGE